MKNKIDEILKIEAECFPYDGWTKEGIKDSLESPNCKKYFLGDQNDKIIAYMFCNTCADEAELLKIAVDKTFQGKNIGTRLLSLGLSDLKQSGINKCFLEVRNSNEPAIKLYRKAGFDELGRRKNFYHDPLEDAIVMKLEMEDK